MLNKHLKRALMSVTLLACTAGFGGCGQTGPLYLPSKTLTENAGAVMGFCDGVSTNLKCAERLTFSKG